MTAARRPSTGSGATRPAFRARRLVADAWCAAFGLGQDAGRAARDRQPGPAGPAGTGGRREPPRNPREICRLRGEHRYFHWHLEFPDVFRVSEGGEDPVAGGFSCVLSARHGRRSTAARGARSSRSPPLNPEDVRELPGAVEVARAHRAAGRSPRGFGEAPFGPPFPQVQQDPVDDRGRRVRRLGPAEGRAPGIGDQASRAERQPSRATSGTRPPGGGHRPRPAGQPPDLRQGLRQRLVGVVVAACSLNRVGCPGSGLALARRQGAGIGTVVAVGRPERLVGDAALDQLRARTDQGAAQPDMTVQEGQRRPGTSAAIRRRSFRPLDRLTAHVHAVDAVAHHLAQRAPPARPVTGSPPGPPPPVARSYGPPRPGGSPSRSGVRRRHRQQGPSLLPRLRWRSSSASRPARPAGPRPPAPAQGHCRRRQSTNA